MRFMRILHFIFLFLFWLLSFNIYGEDDKCHRSTEGTDFWFGFMEGRNDNENVHYIEITVTASQATNFKIYIGKSLNSLCIEALLMKTIRVEFKFRLNLAKQPVPNPNRKKEFIWLLNNPVNVYALNWDRNSADVAVMYPVASLGKEYFTMCYTPSCSQ